MSAQYKTIIDASQLHRLIQVLADHGHRVVGPTVRDELIVYDDLSGVNDLPAG